MVGFGDSLRKTRRPGWEEAYLNYGELKVILHRLKEVIAERERRFDAHLSFAADQDNYHEDSTSLAVVQETDYDSLDNTIHRYSQQFTTKLHREIEKVSLFCLARVGELADAVGSLRIRGTSTGEETQDVEALSPRNNDNVVRDEEGIVMQEEGLNLENYGERAALLPPASGRRQCSESSTTSSVVFSRNLFPKEIKGLNISNREDEDRSQIYSELGVELLHLMKFACLNAVGIRKIIKKYDKTFLAYPHVEMKAEQTRKVIQNENSFIFTPQGVIDRIESVKADRLLQLVNNPSFTTIYASLLDALVECENDALRSMGIHESTLSEPILLSRDVTVHLLQQSKNTRGTLSLARFECAVSSIHTIREFAKDISTPFQVFLSRRAMIGAGKDYGEVGSPDKKAIELLLVFEPDFILNMSECDLYEWYERATEKSTLHKKHPSIDTPFLIPRNQYWGGVDRLSMVLNLMSILLYTINYYIISPTANHYAILLGADGAVGASLIGASSLAAIFAACFYSVWYTRLSFRSALIFSAVCPLLGNLLYALAITYESINLALVGRVFCGFGSAEVINRQLISACVEFQHMTKASALFVTASAIGMSIGPLIAAILDMTAGRDTDIDISIHLPWSPKDSGVVFDHVTMPGFIMSILWAIQLLALLFLFKEPDRINTDTASDDAGKTLHRPNGFTPFVAFYRTVFKNPAFPVTLYLFAFIELAGEILISSCSMIVRRYFRWHASVAGFIVASLGALVLPAHFIVERASRSYSERRILKLSIIITMIGIVGIFNFEGIVFDLIGVVAGKKVVKHSLKHGEFTYDWGVGVYVYLTGLSVIFISTIIMEGVNTSMMSKSAPRELNNSFINVGLLATLVGTFGRVIGDSMIVLTAFVGRRPLFDFVSTTYFPMLPMILFGWLVVNRNYKLLV